MPVVIRRPTGDGIVNQWLIYPASPTTHYDKVDEDPSNDDTDYIYPDSYDRVECFTKDPISGGIPVSVTVKVNIRRTVAGSSGFEIGVKVGNQIYFEYKTINTTTYTLFSHTWDNSPATGSEWTLDEINNMQFAVRIPFGESADLRVTQIWVEIELAEEKYVNESGIGSDLPIIGLTLADVAISFEFISVGHIISDAGSAYENIINSLRVGDGLYGNDQITSISSATLLADAGTGIELPVIWLSCADAGTNQQEAVGMGAVYDPKYENITLGPLIIDLVNSLDQITSISSATLLADAGTGIELPVIWLSCADAGTNQQEAVGIVSGLTIFDTGVGIDQLANIFAAMTMPDIGSGIENVGLSVTFLVIDGGQGHENILMSASLQISEAGFGTEFPVIGFTVADGGQGSEYLPNIATAYFLVDSRGILHPLGVFVLRDSRQDLLPGTRENTEEIPGRHGEIDFGSELRPRLLELHVSTQELDPSQREQIKRAVAKWLNPLLGAQNLIFADDIEKTYRVKYAGKIDLSRMFPNWLEFTIPFKVSDPFIIATWEKQQTGSGTLTNEGTVETPLIIEIVGPVTNPSVVVGGQTLSYTGSLAAGDKMVIDTEKMTVTFNGINALGSYSGGFPKLQPGDTEVTAAAGGTTTWKWRDRWI